MVGIEDEAPGNGSVIKWKQRNVDCINEILACSPDRELRCETNLMIHPRHDTTYLGDYDEPSWTCGLVTGGYA